MHWECHGITGYRSAISGDKGRVGTSRFELYLELGRNELIIFVHGRFSGTGLFIKSRGRLGNLPFLVWGLCAAGRILQVVGGEGHRGRCLRFQ